MYLLMKGQWFNIQYSCTLELNNEAFLTDFVELIHYAFVLPMRFKCKVLGFFYKVFREVYRDVALAR